MYFEKGTLQKPKGALKIETLRTERKLSIGKLQDKVEIF